MWDVWFLGQIEYSTIEHPWIINEITTVFTTNFYETDVMSSILRTSTREYESLYKRMPTCKGIHASTKAFTSVTI